jgi:hypothetical protein
MNAWLTVLAASCVAMGRPVARALRRDGGGKALDVALSVPLPEGVT